VLSRRTRDLPRSRHQPVKLAPRQMLQKPMKNAILMAHGIDPPSRVRIVGETSRTEWNQCHAPCPAKLNRTAVDLIRLSTGPLKRTSVSQKAWITGTSPVMTTVAVCQAPKGSGQLVEQRFRVFKVGCVEAFGEPSVDRREQVAGFGAAPLVAAEPGKARGGT